MSAHKKPVRGRPFTKGHDPRRHKLTTEERQRGFVNAFWCLAARDLDAAAWLYRRVRKHYGWNAMKEQAKNPPLRDLDAADDQAEPGFLF